MQISKFLVISGTGWLIDFLIYLLLTIKLNFDVGYSNFISGIPALTFVFLVSTRKIFEYNTEGFSLKRKYSIYFSLSNDSYCNNIVIWSNFIFNY